MKPIILLVTLLATNLSIFETTWEKVEVNSNVSISFPAKPVKNDPGNGQKTFILKQADSTANYIVIATDLGVAMGIDEATLTAEMEKEESWEQAKTAFVNSMGADAKLLKDEMTIVKGSKGLKLVLDRKTENGAVNILTVLIFVKGTTSYNVIFNNRGGKADEKMKELFFNSIEIK